MKTKSRAKGAQKTKPRSTYNQREWDINNLPVLVSVICVLGAIGFSIIIATTTIRNSSVSASVERSR